MEPGSRVKVVNAGSPHSGRTGLVEATASPGQWHVVFDWPLGGVAGRAILAEDDLEILATGSARDPRMDLRK